MDIDFWTLCILLMFTKYPLKNHMTSRASQVNMLVLAQNYRISYGTVFALSKILVTTLWFTKYYIIKICIHQQVVYFVHEQSFK